jgi:hypothetical protein
LPEIVSYFNDIGVLATKNKLRNFNINLVDAPQRYSIPALPDDFKIQVKEKLLNFFTEFKTKTGYDVSGNFNHVIDLLNQPHKPEWRKDFVSFTKILDDIRNENTYEVIPELKCML